MCEPETPASVDRVWNDETKQKLLEVLEAAGVPEHAMVECGINMLTEMTRWVANKEIRDFTHSYLVAIRRLDPDEGGGYAACIPQLGSGAFNGCGDSPAAALNCLQECYDFMSEYLEKEKEDWAWPEPKDEDNIEWNDKKRMSAEEVHAKFSEYLAKAKIRRHLNKEK